MDVVYQILIDALRDLDPNRIDGNTKNSPKNIKLIGKNIHFDIADQSYIVKLNRKK